MIFALDTGNDKIKTETAVTQAGLKKLDYVPEKSEGAILYNGEYYVDTVERIAYLYDKTVDERYYILSLLALARELEHMDTKEVTTKGLIQVALLVGLPPAHYAALRNRFRDYFFREGKPVSFEYKGKSYCVAFSEVYVNVQGYAVYMMLGSKMKLSDNNKVCLIDLGGMTMDYLLLRYGELDKADSLELGMITLYNKIRLSINRRCHMLLDEQDIYNILKKNPTKFPENIIGFVFEIAREYVFEILGIYRELGIDFNTTVTIFAGGGAILLADAVSDVWKGYQGEYFIVDDIHANAKGYKIKYLIEHDLIQNGGDL